MIEEEILEEGQFAQSAPHKEGKPKRGKHKEKHPKHDTEKPKQQIWHAS